MIIDGLQYANWSEKIFRQMRKGGVDAVHVTIAYHETFREAVANVEEWNRLFTRFPDLICPAHTGADVRRAKEEGRTAILFGFQNPSPIEDDIGLIEVWHTLGARFMQLTYNNQSLLAGGCWETEDAGVSRMGRRAIAEMNRVGMVVDMSHSADRSTFEAMEISTRPIAITHANPAFWHSAVRNKPDAVLKALAESGGMLGFSLYPHHLKDGSACTIESFCEMVARTAEIMGIGHIGIGSDLCQDQPDEVVAWMRAGRWSGETGKETENDAKSGGTPGFPPMPKFFRDNRDFTRIARGLGAVGFDADEVARIMGLNWLDFFDRSFGPEGARADG